MLVRNVITLGFINLLFFSGVGFASNVTYEFKNYFSSRFEARGQSSGNKTFDYTRRQNLLVGSITVGHKVRSHTSIRVGDLSDWNGEAAIIDMSDYPDLGRWVGTGRSLGVDMTMKFPYSGSSEGKKYIYPSGNYVDTVWSSLHPRGTIEVTVANKQGSFFSVYVRYTASSIGGDSRANDHALELARSLEPLAINIVKEYMSDNNIQGEVTRG